MGNLPDRPGSTWPPWTCEELEYEDDDEDIVVVGSAGGSGSGSSMLENIGRSQQSLEGFLIGKFWNFQKKMWEAFWKLWVKSFAELLKNHFFNLKLKNIFWSKNLH